MKRITKSMLTVLEFGSKSYGWQNLPRITSVPREQRRAFGLPTIQALVRRRLIRFQPARIYVAGRGRAILRQRNKS